MIKNEAQQIVSILGIPGVPNATTLTGGSGGNAYTTTLGNISNISNITNASNAPPYLMIGKLKLTNEEYEVCMRHLLDLTKQAHPEEFI